MDIQEGESNSIYGKFDTKNEPKEGKVITFLESAKAMATTGSLNIMLLLMPIAIISYAAEWPDVVTFIFSLLALAPLAERLGYVTEQLALHTNESIGGLLNATFGNATELIVAITALNKGLYRLVQLSLLGSILSNMLLVLGSAFLLGGMYHKTQSYGTISSQVNSTLMMLSVMGILFPTVLSSSGYESREGLLGLSRATSLILFCIYGCYLYFQLHSHKHLYEDSPSEKLPDAVISRMHREDIEKQNSHTEEKSIGEGNAVTSSTNDQEKDGDDEEEEDELGFYNALIWLCIITAFIAVLSEAISDSIQDAANSANISGVFIASILLPIVGNAAEHAGAIVFAAKGKVDLTLGVAIGSSTQIALCVLPLLVLIAWMCDRDLTLDFGGFESVSLFFSVVAVTFVIKDGTSNWLMGAALIGAYCIIACAFWAHINEPLDSSGGR